MHDGLGWENTLPQTVSILYTYSTASIKPYCPNKKVELQRALPEADNLLPDRDTDLDKLCAILLQVLQLLLGRLHHRVRSQDVDRVRKHSQILCRARPRKNSVSDVSSG